MIVRRLRLILTAAVLAATTLAFPAASPASAAACSNSTGVTVVVDANQLGGGVHQVCDGSGAGKTAATIFKESGFELTYTNQGMVCRVDGAPATDPCQTNPPANAYWSLWWSDGSSGSWSYSSLGVGSLKIPAGGSVAWAWQGQTARAVPGVAPHQAAPSPTAKPSTSAPAPAPTKKAQPKVTQKAAGAAKPTPVPTTVGVTVTPSAAQSPTASPTTGATTSPTGTVAASPTATDTAAPPGTASPSPASTSEAESQSAQTQPASATDDGGLPGWVPPVIIVVLVAAAGGVAWARKARSTP